MGRARRAEADGPSVSPARGAGHQSRIRALGSARHQFL